jgi:hypothetical protein
MPDVTDELLKVIKITRVIKEYKLKEDNYKGCFSAFYLLIIFLEYKLPLS